MHVCRRSIVGGACYRNSADRTAPAGAVPSADGGWLIELGLVVYAAALVVLLLTLTGVFRIRQIVGLERAVLAISGVVMITYCIVVSAALYALSQATDL